MQCEDSAVRQQKIKDKKPIYVQVSICKDIVVTGTNSGQVTILDIPRRAILYQGAPHGYSWVNGVCAYNDVVATGAMNGSLAIMSVLNNKEVIVECR